MNGDSQSSQGDSESQTIVACAVDALRKLGRPATIDDIYDHIVTHGLYSFNTDVPKHVLRTSIRRHTHGADRVDAASVVLFEETNEVYQLLASSTKRKSQIGMKRIHRAKDKAEVIDALTTELEIQGVKTPPPFKEIWRLLMFCAALGFREGKREPLHSVDQGKGIDQSSFGNSPAWPGILYLMGLVETGGTQPLAATEDAEGFRIQLFEEYANAGLTILKEKCGHDEPDLRFIINFINDKMTRGVSGDPDLKIAI